MSDCLRCPELINLIGCCICFAGNERSDVNSSCCFWPKEQTGNWDPVEPPKHHITSGGFWSLSRSPCRPGLSTRVTVVVTPPRLCWVNAVLRAPYGNPVQISSAGWTANCRMPTLSSLRSSRSSSRYRNLRNLKELLTRTRQLKYSCLWQLIVEQQEDQLELVSGTIGVLKNMSERIGMELDEQAV